MKVSSEKETKDGNKECVTIWKSKRLASVMSSSILGVQREGTLPRRTQALERLLPAGIPGLGEREREGEEGGR